MIIINTKLVLFNFLPYEYKALEKYLEDMALKGWKLQSIRGVILKFKRIEPKRIKYSVDIMDKVSFWGEKNSDRTLEYREYCKVAGWNFVCGREKIQVYCSENEIESIPIHTEEEEKFNCIFKASLKYVLFNFVTYIMLLLTQYMITIGSNDAGFLANNLQLFSLAIVIMFVIHESIGFINFIIWIVKGRRSLKRNQEVSYNYFKGIKIKRVIYRVIIMIGLMSLLFVIISGERFVLKIFASNLLMVVAIYTLMNFVSKTKYKYKKKRIINIMSYVVIIMLSFIIMNGLIFSGIFSGNRENEIKKDNYILTLKDFNNEAIDEEALYINENNGILASTLHYSNKGKNEHLSYELFQSKYEWAVKYDFNKIMSWMKEINVKYIEKETNLPDSIKVYMNEHGHIYLMVSSNKLIEISGWDKNLSEDELFNKVYEKVFMDN
ncbi:DUF2812 domain-containing protein [Clostridium gasigenes]|uniref:DUF2812 domain-containing protein n=1 Tax=Clostridium gasigenes TaxID=94869 RepID=UPI001C0AADE0|nr:DUF2812 domain-containing protein [Clostridium gasigenes]MBU3105587.1 DUF2812 domain-containing protein [Clostridium gasigenes]